MKTMTCRQLGGACDEVFAASTFEEISEMSRNHGMEMFKAGDAEHIKAMEEMKALMEVPEIMQKWMDDRRKEFDALPDE